MLAAIRTVIGPIISEAVLAAIRMVIGPITNEHWILAWKPAVRRANRNPNGDADATENGGRGPKYPTADANGFERLPLPYGSGSLPYGCADFPMVGLSLCRIYGNL